MRVDLAALPFAHLLGLATPKPPAPRASEDDDAPRGPAATAPGAHLAGVKADDKAKDESADKAKDGYGDKPMPADGTDPADTPEEEDAGDGKKKKGEDAEAATTDGTNDAAASDKARGKAIFASPHAAGPGAALAAFLAFETTLPAAQAATVLELASAMGQAGRAAGGELSAAMASFAGARPGHDAPPKPSGMKAIDASWDAAAQSIGVLPRG